MNLKKSLMGLVAGLALVGTIAAPVVADAPAESNGGNNQTTAAVNVTTSGEFDVYFYSAALDFGSVDFGAQSNVAVVRPGSLQIGYVDTLVQRPSFDVTLQAGNFDSGAAWFSGDALKVTKTYNVLQGQWDSVATGNVGDIGAYINNGGTVAQCNGCSWSWSSGQDLGTAKAVGFGYSGIGTVWSTAQVDVSLTIPPTTAPGYYSSTLMLTVVSSNQP